jgi:hypothetical protein
MLYFPGLLKWLLENDFSLPICGGFKATSYTPSARPKFLSKFPKRQRKVDKVVQRQFSRDYMTCCKICPLPHWPSGQRIKRSCHPVHYTSVQLRTRPWTTLAPPATTARRTKGVGREECTGEENCEAAEEEDGVCQVGPRPSWCGEPACPGPARGASCPGPATGVCWRCYSGRIEIFFLQHRYLSKNNYHMLPVTALIILFLSEVSSETCMAVICRTQCRQGRWARGSDSEPGVKWHKRTDLLSKRKEDMFACLAQAISSVSTAYAFAFLDSSSVVSVFIYLSFGLMCALSVGNVFVYVSVLDVFVFQGCVCCLNILVQYWFGLGTTRTYYLSQFGGLIFKSKHSCA